MKNLKIALALVATFVVLQVANAQDYFNRLAMEGVEIVGAITYGKVDKYTTMTKGYYAFNYDQQFEPVKTSPLYAANVSGGCVYHDGKIYSNEFDDAGQVQQQKPKWRIYDAKTFNLLSEHELSDNCDNTTSSLAYDPTTNQIYGINYTYTESYVVKVDPETGQMTRLGNMRDPTYRYFSLGCNKAGVLYCIYMNPETDAWYLGKIRKSDGKLALVKAISVTNLLPGDSYVNSTNKQALFYNNATDKFYWMFGGSSMYLYAEYTCLAELDPVSATASMVAYMPSNFVISGAFFEEPKLSAPAIAEDFSFVPDGESSLQGVMKLTAPTTSYDGQPLTGKVNVTITEGDSVLLTTSLAPGAEFTSQKVTFSNGRHTVAITTANADGEGPTIKRSFYVGYDLPNACKNIKLTADGLKTYLTWEAPTTGQNGAPINQDNLTYTVVRYPYEVTVATNLKDCHFEEEHSGDMTRYVYLVTPNDGDRKGKSAFSNNLIVGTPLEVPYGGSFTGPADMLNYYTLIDANGDNYSWKYDLNYNAAVYQFNSEAAADDWMIAPPVKYKKGHTYVLTFSGHSSMSNYLEALAVTFGDGRTPEQQQVIQDYPEFPALDEDGLERTFKVEFTAPEDGIYYYGFHCYSPAFHGALYLTSVRVEDKNTDGIAFVSDEDGVSVLSQKGGMLINNAKGQMVTVYDANGRKVYETHSHSAATNLPKGLYLVNANGKVMKTIVK